MLDRRLDGRTFGVGTGLRGKCRGERRFLIAARLSLRGKGRSVWVFLLALVLRV